MKDRPLRILQIVSGSATSGAELHTLVLARQLARRGHAVEVVCPQIGWMVSELRANGITAHAVDMKKAKSLHAHRRVYRLLKEGRYDLVHTHLTRATYLGTVSGLLRHVPVVASVHVESSDNIYRLAARRSNRLVAVSNYIRDHLTQRGVRPEFIDVVYNGTDFVDVQYEQTLDVHREFQIPLGRDLVGLVARVGPEKGHIIAVRALAQVARRAPSVHMMFIGRTEGDFPAYLRQTAGELGVADRITFTGHREDVARMFDAMSFSIFPSLKESFGLAVIESMARGRPVVASRVGGIPELVVHQETGLLVEQTPEALSAGMNYMFENAEDRERMGRNARDLIEAKFTVHQMVERLEAVYHRAVGS